jgi:hypothetical protein
MFRPLTVLLIGASLAVSSAAIAQERHDDRDHHEQEQSKRYYDRNAKDYHEWNSDEDRRYHEYLRERHLNDRDFDRLNNRDRDAYFKWRHDHDNDHHEERH